MKFIFLTSIITSFVSGTAPLHAAPPLYAPWNAEQGPETPLRYVESGPTPRLAPAKNHTETYASDALHRILYPSISASTLDSISEESNIQSIIVSKNGDFQDSIPRGNLSTSYLQEYAYIDLYSNTGDHDKIVRLPSIQMSLATPQYGNGFGGGYLPFRFGFGPLGFGF